MHFWVCAHTFCRAQTNVATIVASRKLHLKAVQIDILIPCRETKSKSCGQPPDQQSDAVGPRMKLFKCSESNWPCTEPEQYWAEALRQGSRAQLVSGIMQADSGQMTHHAKQCQAILGRAAGRAGNASQHLSTVLHVLDLCEQKWTKGLNHEDQDPRNQAPYLTLNCTNHVSLQDWWEDGTRQVLQEPQHPAAQRQQIQLLQVWKNKHTSVQ